jgi:twinkle protein
MTIEWLIDKAEDAVVRFGIKWLLLDPWNQIQHKRSRGESTEEYQERAIRAVKRWCRSFGVGVIVVAHPTKDVKLSSGELRKPGLYDISGSAHWFNAADHGIVVSGDTKTSVREITVEKSRYQQYAGRPGSAWLELKNGRLVPAPQPVEAEV